MLIIRTVVLVLSLNIKVFGDPVFPASPCPSIFSYAMTNNGVHGVVRLQNDYSGYYKVEVNMTLGAFTNTNIAIQRSSPIEAVQNGEDVVFNVMFPPGNVLPKISSIVFNEKLYCSATRIQEPGGFTTLNAVFFFSSPIISKGSLHKPYIQQAEPVQSSNNPTQDTSMYQKPSTEHSPSVYSSNTPTKLTSIYQKPSTQRTEPIRGANGASQQTSTMGITFPNDNQSMSPVSSNINQLFDLTSRPHGVSQMASTSFTKVDIKYFETSSKPYTPDFSIPVKVTERLPTTSKIDINLIANRFLQEITCGMTEDTQALVVHGTPTSEDQHPWLIAMFHLQETNSEYKFKCAANLVSNKHVVTAAHCVRTQKSVSVPKDNIILVLGKHNIRSWAVRSEIRNAQEIYVHPDYKQPSDADIAVIVMSKTIEFTSTIQPICLWTEDTSLDIIVGSNGTVIGWGRDESDNAYVAEPKQLNMPIASQEDCLRSDERFFKITSNRTFCAGSRKGEGVCTGDSGGGFIIRRRGKWTLRGIVSSALVDPLTRSCDVNNYMVFSDVAKVMPWISRIMAK